MGEILFLVHENVVPQHCKVGTFFHSKAEMQGLLLTSQHDEAGEQNCSNFAEKKYVLFFRNVVFLNTKCIRQT